MSNLPDLSALAQRLAQRLALLQQQASSPAGSPGAGAAQAELDALAAALREQGVDISTGGVVRFGPGANIGTIETLIGGDKVDGDKFSGDKFSGDKFVIETLNLQPAPSTPAPSAPHEVPAPVSDFIGREEELEKLVTAITAGRTTVAAISGLHGLGGIGKTELARKVVEQVAGRFPDGVLLVDLFGSRGQAHPGGLAPLTPAQALRELLQPLLPGEPLADEQPMLEKRFQSALRGKRVLILADDAGSRAQVAPLVPPPGSALLITSRVSFRLPGMVPLELGRLPKERAVELLREICPRMGEPEAQEIARLCGGLPLALRISATLLSLDDARPVAIYDAAGTLTGGYLYELAQERGRLAALRDPLEDGDAASGQRPYDVEASLMLSYAQLAPADQAAFRLLGVFAAPFDARAAGAVMAENGQQPNPERLHRLRRFHLLEYDSDAQRYSLHELVRVFALARLAEAGPEAERAVRVRHAKHYIDVIVDANRQFKLGGEGMLTGLALFDQERFNLDSARAWLHSQSQNTPQNEIDRLLIIDADATIDLGKLRYQDRNEHINLLNNALAAAQRLNDLPAQGAALGNLGSLYLTLGDFKNAISFFEQDIVILKEINDREGTGTTLGNLGHVYLTLDDPIRAINIVEQALIIACEVQNRQGEASALNNLGFAYMIVGELYDAINFFKRSLVIMRNLGNRQGERSTLTNLGIAYRRMDNIPSAIFFFEQALAAAREIGDRQGEGKVLGNLANAYQMQGDTRCALAFFEQRIAIAHEINDYQGAADANWNIGNVLLRDDPARALTHLEQGLSFYRQINHPRKLLMEDAIMRLLTRVELHNKHQSSYLPKEPQNTQDNTIEQKCFKKPPIMQGFMPLLRGIAAIARGNIERRDEIEDMLSLLEHLGWQLTSSVNQIWNGHRDITTLSADIDTNSAILIQNILFLIENPEIETDNVEAIIDLLPEQVRIALENQDEDALQNTLETLTTTQKHETMLLLAKFNNLTLINIPPNPRFFYATLLRTVAWIALGETELQTLVQTKMTDLDQQGWMLSEPVQRIWLGERDAMKLKQDLDEQSTALIEYVLELVATYECGKRQTPSQLRLALPNSVRDVLDQQDEAVLNTTLERLSPEERVRVDHILAQLASEMGSDDQSHLFASNQAGIHESVQNYLPLLGDIALAAYGNADARELAEAALPLMEQNDWHITEATQRIWEGERDADVLTVGLDIYSATLVWRTLSLLAYGPDMIFVAQSLQIDHLRRQAGELTAQALRDGDTAARAALAQQLTDRAQRADRQPGAPWQALAGHLRGLAGQLLNG